MSVFHLSFALFTSFEKFINLKWLLNIIYHVSRSYLVILTHIKHWLFFYSVNGNRHISPRTKSPVVGEITINEKNMQVLWNFGNMIDWNCCRKHPKTHHRRSRNRIFRVVYPLPLPRIFSQSEVHPSLDSYATDIKLYVSSILFKIRL